MHSFTVLGYVCLTIPTLVQLYRQLIRTTAVCSGTFPIRKSVKYHRSILVLRSCYLNASNKLVVPNMAVYIFQMEMCYSCICPVHIHPFVVVANIPDLPCISATLQSNFKVSNLRYSQTFLHPVQV